MSTTEWCDLDGTSHPIDNIITETRSYNVIGQLTSKQFGSSESGCWYVSNLNIWVTTSTNFSGGLGYSFSATQNNGQITQVNDTMVWPGGETIAYQYDALKRLTSAAGTPNPNSSLTPWTQTFQYDGFGNLTGKVLGGTTTSIGVTAATNRLSNSTYDLNGNMLTGVGATFTYDEANRMASATPTSGGTERYGYAPDNKRIYRLGATGYEEFGFFGAFGERLGTYYWYDPWNCETTCVLAPYATNVYFAGEMITNGSTSVPAATLNDRLGTNRRLSARFRPYGDEITSTANQRVKFGTYTRDSFTTLDYADQRYYASSYGRFNTADPYQASAGPSDPGSWNRYAYVGGDPVNRSDRRGTCYTDDQGDWAEDSGIFWETQFGGYGSPINFSDVGYYPGLCQQDPMYVYYWPDPCSQIDSNALVETNCGGPIVPVYEPPPDPPAPTCTVEVGYLTHVFGSPFSHSFFELDYYGVTDYVEVSPNLATLIPTMKVNVTGTGIYGDSTAGIDFWHETGASACADAAGIIGRASQLGPSLYLGPISNSNSFVSTILGEIGITLASGPPNAVGWGLPILPIPGPGRIPVRPIRPTPPLRPARHM